MSQKKPKSSSLAGWIISAILIAGSFLLWMERQWVVDAIQYYQYTPTAAVATLTKDAGLTELSKFTFYATRPAVETSDQFNRNCQRKEADSPILGCYSNGRIYVYDVTDDRLKGIKVVTTAHELLHAEYERLTEAEKKKLEPLLRAVYQKVTNSDLEARMKYYEKTEPGESLNELHSIIGTEFASINPELESHYKRFLNNRQSLVALHAQVEQTFDALSKEADELVNRIEKLASGINRDTKQYNEDIARLNADVQAFNKRAGASGGFTTQSEFNTARQQIMAQSAALNESRQSIQVSIATYKTLLSRLDAINAESASLNQGLDSALSDIPTV